MVGGRPRGVAEEEDEEEEEEEEDVVIEVVDGEEDEDEEERFVPLGPGRPGIKGPARGALKVGGRCRTLGWVPDTCRVKPASSTEW